MKAVDVDLQVERVYEPDEAAIERAIAILLRDEPDRRAGEAA